MLSRSVRIAIVTDHDVIYRGLASVLADFGHEVELLERTGGMLVDVAADVILYDVARLHDGDGTDLERLVKETHAAVVAVARELRPDLADQAISKGVDGLVGLSAHADEIRTVVVAAALGDLAGDASVEAGDYTGNPTTLGRTEGLSARESEVIALITAGLSNQEIALRTYLSINSVKTYIRTAYRKIGVTTRPQAVGWAIQRGYTPPDEPETGQRGDLGA